MDPASNETPSVGNFPDLQFSRPSSQVDLSLVKPHVCMQNIEQRGNYIHCRDGNHGMRIPAGKILNKDKNGNWILEDMKIIDFA